MARTRRTARSRPVRNISDETAILPHIVADSVIDEVARCVPLKADHGERRDMADRLGDKADRVYKANARFRKSIRAPGNRGRDQLFVWMRHWVSGELKDRDPSAFAKLPHAFIMGRPLRCR